MLLEVGIIAAGIPFGYILRKKEEHKRTIDKIASYTLYTLLFFLGLQIGSNDNVMGNLDKLGLKALIFGIVIVFACLFAGSYLEKRFKNF